MPSSPLYSKAHDQILVEIENGNYFLATTTPKIISPLGVISKPEGVLGLFMIVVGLQAEQ